MANHEIEEKTHKKQLKEQNKQIFIIYYHNYYYYLLPNYVFFGFLKDEKTIAEKC